MSITRHATVAHSAAFAAVGILSIVLLAAGISGCATHETSRGEPIPEVDVEQIVEGETTKDDIYGMFGSPDSRSTDGDREIFTYKHTTIESETGFFPYFSKGSSMETSDELTVIFDEQDVVDTYHITRGQ